MSEVNMGGNYDFCKKCKSIIGRDNEFCNDKCKKEYEKEQNKKIKENLKFKQSLEGIETDEIFLRNSHNYCVFCGKKIKGGEGNFFLYYNFDGKNNKYCKTTCENYHELKIKAKNIFNNKNKTDKDLLDVATYINHIIKCDEFLTIKGKSIKDKIDRENRKKQKELDQKRKLESKGGPFIKCLNCGNSIQSTHRHDFVTCSCGKVSIDGGSNYTRIVGDKEFWEFVK